MGFFHPGRRAGKQTASPSNETRNAPDARLQRQRYPSRRALPSQGFRLVLPTALNQETLASGWHEVPPPRRSWHVAVFDSRRNRLLLCAGAFHGTLWSYGLGTRTWSEIPLAAPGPAFVGACGIYDPIRDRIVVFGGEYSADTWVLDLRGALKWTKLSATGLTAREEASAAYDPVGDRMIVFGGLRFVDTFTDLATLDLSRPTKWKVFAAVEPRSPRAVGAHRGSPTQSPGRDRRIHQGRDFGSCLQSASGPRQLGTGPLAPRGSGAAGMGFSARLRPLGSRVSRARHAQPHDLRLLGGSTRVELEHRGRSGGGVELCGDP